MSIDKVLAALDAGLQSSDEHGYPDRIDDPTRCARCLLHEPVEDGFCSGCRSFLLGDSDEDPTRPIYGARQCGDGCRGCEHCWPGRFHRLASEHAQAMERRLLAEIEDRGAWSSLASAMNVSDEEVDRMRARFADLADTGIAHVCDSTCRGVCPQWRDDQERFHARGPVRMQRLDCDGNPTGVPEDLRGYVTMHLNGDRYDNRPENLAVMPATENASVGWFRRHLSVTSALRFVIEYYGYGMRGQYFTDDPRPFTVAEYVSDGWRGVQLVDADGDRMHWVAVASHESRPAAFRVSSSIAVPEWHAVTCQRCGAIYACDPQRTAEAHGIIANDGHGTGGSCDPLTHTRAEVTEGHDAEATDAPPGWLAHPRQRRDWQAEALAWARQGRRWLGL